MPSPWTTAAAGVGSRPSVTNRAQSDPSASAPDGYRHLLDRLLGGARVRSERINLVDAAAAVWSRPRIRHPDVGADPHLRAVRLPAADRFHRAGPDAWPGDPGGRGRAREDHRGRAGAVRATAARAGAPRPRGHPGRARGPVAGGTGTQVRPADDRSAARRMGELRGFAGGGRLDRHRPPGSDQVGTGGRAVGSHRGGRGSSTAEPAVGLGHGSPANSPPATCCC